MCEQPAGNLVDGSLPNPVNNGFVMVLRDLTATGDLVGDTTPETVAVISCSAGGIGWPQTIHVYAPGPVHLAQIDLAEFNPDGIVALVESVEIVDRALTVRWKTDAPEDASCYPTILLQGRFTLSVAASGEVTVREGSLPSVVTTGEAASTSTAASGVGSPTVDAAIARFVAWINAYGLGDAETFCEIGGPAYEALGVPSDACGEMLANLRTESEEELGSIAAATVDASQVVQVAPDRVEIPAGR